MPFVALVLLAAARAPARSTSGARAFVAAALSVTVLLVLEVAVFAAGNAQRIEERNMFYVVPLLR